VGTGQFIWHQAALSFMWMVAGGAGIGLLLAWLFVQAHKRLPTDAASDVIFTLIEPYILYWVAEEFHSSGVLAVVCGGLYMSTHRLLFLNSTSRVKGYSVWESFVFILNGIVFFIIGLGLPAIVNGLKANGIPLRTAIWDGVLVTLILIAVRIISSYIALLTTIIFRPGVTPQFTDRRRLWQLPLLLGWTGMRGVVSLAAALSIPVALSDGSAFPQRNLILFITFMVILLTLLLQGLTLPYFIKRSRLFEITNEPPDGETLLKLQQGLRHHGYHFLKDKYEHELNGHDGLEKMLRHMEGKMNSGNDGWMNDKMKVVYLQLLESQRQYLVQQNKDIHIDEEIIRLQLYQIDLEEEKFKMM
jgi:NhaP-type Na+/H+ or K+/H+ antiporter